MNAPNEEQKNDANSKNPELPGQQAASCGAGCGCHSAAGPGKTRWVIGLVVLAAAGVMAARAITGSGGTQSSAAASGFAVPDIGAGSTNSGTSEAGAEKSLGPTLGALSELNTVAAKTDAVFIFVPGKEGSGAAAAAPMRAAVRIVETQGLKCGLFTLQPGCKDYDAIIKQVTAPTVLALVKGGSMVLISGEITETKLVQGFVAASRAGSCSGSTCGPSGCN